MASAILLLASRRSANPFGHYLGEILKAEGLNSFEIADVDTVDAEALRRHPIVILTETPLRGRQIDLLSSYVREGGRLIAMRPPAELAPLFGVEPTGGTTAEGYVLVDTARPPGQGVVDVTLQYHGEADNYRIAGAEPIAWLYRDASDATPFPAVTMQRFGRGVTALWAFDLARSVAYTRQGNPDWIELDRDGIEGITAVDMFVGWVDPQRVGVAQADEHQRLLANVVAALGEDITPLPRLWYFPAGADGLLIVTSDSHGNPAPWVEDLMERVERRGGRLTVYYEPHPWDVSLPRQIARELRRRARALPLAGSLIPNPSAPTPYQVAEWRARGHEFGFHPGVEEGVDAGYRRCAELFERAGYGPASPTVRTHRTWWKGWVETARVQASYGLRMNVDYYHLSPALRDATGEWAYGHFTGSALPMKLVDEQGRILDVYQQLTQLADEHLLKVWWWDGPSLGGRQAAGVSRMLIDRSLERAYGPTVVQLHADLFNPTAGLYDDIAALTDGVLDHAVSRGIPIWSAQQWLAFVEARHDAEIADVRWDAAKRLLTFSVQAATPPGADLGVMLPIQHGGARFAQATIDRAPARFREKTLVGVAYALFAVPAGRHEVSALYAPATPT